MSIEFYLIVPLFSACVVLLVNLLKTKASALGLIDKVNERSSHLGVVPKLGGLSIFLPFFFLTIILYILNVDFIKPHLPLIIGLMATVTLGWIDDRLDLSGKLKFIIQICIGAYYITFTGNYVDSLNGLFGIYDLNPWVGISLSTITIAFLINAVNLSDGVDGLSASTSLLSLLIFTLLMGKEHHYYILTFIGAGLLINLRYNFSIKKKMFLGDAGSLGLGFILSALAMEFLRSGNEFHSLHEMNPIFIAILALAYPITDTLRVFFLRVYFGQSPFTADRRHLHHVLLSKGYSHLGTTTFIFFTVSFVFCVNYLIAPYINDYGIILFNLGLILVIHLFVRFRSVQLCKFWRSFSRMVFKPVKKVLTRYAIN